MVKSVASLARRGERSSTGVFSLDELPRLQLVVELCGQGQVLLLHGARLGERGGICRLWLLALGLHDVQAIQLDGRQCCSAHT